MVRYESSAWEHDGASEVPLASLLAMNSRLTLLIVLGLLLVLLLLSLAFWLLS
jgi:hypothetical protein